MPIDHNAIELKYTPDRSTLKADRFFIAKKSPIVGGTIGLSAQRRILDDVQYQSGPTHLLNSIVNDYHGLIELLPQHVKRDGLRQAFHHFLMGLRNCIELGGRSQ